MELGSSGRHNGKYIYFPLLCIAFSLVLKTATANVVLNGKNVSLSFDDVEASFTPAVVGSGDCGMLYIAEPLNACIPLKDNVSAEGGRSPIALIIRGGCTFEDKVRNAQDAGFKAAIVYDDEDSGALVSMAGNSVGIKIHAVFVSKASGEELKKYAGVIDMNLWIVPTFENSAWSIMAISFICLLAISAVLAMCFFVQRHRIRRQRPQFPHVREFHGMSSHLVKAMPSIIFTSTTEDSCTSCTCAICLEDYAPGEKLRVLPCRHKFHAVCVDSWLTIWRTFCPVCKHDARTNMSSPPASECTPLLSPPVSVSASPSSSAVLSSSRSYLAASPAIRIAQSSYHSPSSSAVLSSSHSHLAAAPAIRIAQASYHSPVCSWSQSLATTPAIQRTFRYYSNSPAMSSHLSSTDLQTVAFQRSRASPLRSPHSLGLPYLFSSAGSTHGSQVHGSSYLPCSHNASPYHLASPLYVGSSSRHPCLLHHSESTTSFSPLSSAHSLPGC
ncbi:receptor homology region, transmembrane domain- and RING domain-containing protein 5-like [Nymphaea colorata]|nr:receptor homology region, transmembrane domain- and RING domain-containing protein 5-like [Nymphaea colorata]XP_031504566.1 receptor homology region, transmembrane domain- and RING domain-containing protein 5-like [Nymphaea colorata]